MSALKPDDANKHDLGTSVLPWKALHVDEVAIGARAGVSGDKVVIGTAARLNADATDKVNVQIYGDLSVFGSQTTISSTTLEIKDLNITVAKDAADSAAAKALEVGMKILSVEVKGPGSGRETALRALQARGFKIISIKDTTPMPHNGTRPPKKRRV